MSSSGGKQLEPEGSEIDADAQRDNAQPNKGPSTGSDTVLDPGPDGGTTTSPPACTATAASSTTITQAREPMTLLSSDHSPQRAFLGINELVTEVVGYLSSSRQEVVKCLYVCKSFYAAAIPFVYRYIPHESINNVDPTLREKYLRTIIASPVTRYLKVSTISLVPTVSLVEPAIRYPLFFQPRRPTEGWVSISSRETNLFLHFSSDVHGASPWLMPFLQRHPNSFSSRDVIPSDKSQSPPSTTASLTIVLVPPYISGQNFDIDSFFPYQYCATAATFPFRGPINLVGLEFHNPFDKSDRWNTMDLKPKFLDALEEWGSTEFWDMTPDEKDGIETPEAFKRHLLSRIQHVTFKEYLETTSEWKHVLGWRKVGEWLNKYDERQREDVAKHWSMDHLPGGRMTNA